LLVGYEIGKHKSCDIVVKNIEGGEQEILTNCEGPQTRLAQIHDEAEQHSWEGARSKKVC